MFSFTGSRASFRGDVNFYGKQVRALLFLLSCPPSLSFSLSLSLVKPMDIG
jgi:hypothetical protein